MATKKAAKKATAAKAATIDSATTTNTGNAASDFSQLLVKAGLSKYFKLAGEIPPDALNERQEVMLDVMLSMKGDTHLDLYFSADITNRRLCGEARLAAEEFRPDHRARFKVR